MVNPKPVKKPYVKPVIARVRLTSRESVLGSCQSTQASAQFPTCAIIGCEMP